MTIESVASACSEASSALPKTIISTEDSRSYEGGEHHPVTLLGLDPLGLGDHSADRHPVPVAAVAQLGQGAVGLGAQRRADVLERMGGDEQADRFLLGRQQLGAAELLAGDRGVAGPGERRPPRPRAAVARGPEIEDRPLADERVLLGLLARPPGPARAPPACPCGERRWSRRRRI